MINHPVLLGFVCQKNEKFTGLFNWTVSLKKVALNFWMVISSDKFDSKYFGIRHENSNLFIIVILKF